MTFFVLYDCRGAAYALRTYTARHCTFSYFQWLTIIHPFFL
jgi:hypothetical protein